MAPLADNAHLSATKHTMAEGEEVEIDLVIWHRFGVAGLEGGAVSLDLRSRGLPVDVTRA